MQINSMTVRLNRRVNLGDYNHIDVSAEATVVIDPGEKLDAAQAMVVTCVNDLVTIAYHTQRETKLA